MKNRCRPVVGVLHQHVPLIVISLIQVPSDGLMVHPFKHCTPWARHKNEYGALPAELSLIAPSKEKDLINKKQQPYFMLVRPVESLECHRAIHLVFLAQSDIGIKGVAPEMNLAIRL